MVCDQGLINNIEYNLKTNPSKVSTKDLIYYLKCHTNNNNLDSNNLNATNNYLKKINNSFAYENIFLNKSNYSSIAVPFIGLLIPFYYCFPRFYKLGALGIFIGFISLMTIFSKMNELYSIFFSKVIIIFIILSISIYILFFVVLNKLNHISLFFISAVISFFIINYVLRIILTLPIKSNKFNQYKASLNNNKNFTEYNLLLETTCFEIISRYNLKLPSGNMLYSYLTEFNIGTNENLYSDFFTNLFGPIISVFLLWILGFFLSTINDDTILNVNNKISLFPIIGINEHSIKYFTCQANYILPKELNVHLLIHKIVDEYNFDESLYKKVEKALLRISYELLNQYNPKFYKLEYKNKKKIYDNLKYNKVFIEINKILKKNNLDFNFINENNEDGKYSDKIIQLIKKEDIPYKNKAEMYELLSHINNTLKVINEYNTENNNNSILARDELLYDKEIKKEYKDFLKNIIDKYIKNFTHNLNLKDGTLFGYHYNITSYPFIYDKITYYSNKVFAFILRIISTWLLFAKPIGSTWLIVKYILTPSKGFKKLLKILSGNSIAWKYFSMGLDKSYFEEVYKEVKNNNENTIFSKAINFICSILIFIFLLPLLSFYNSTVFGLVSSPSWYNLLYQFVFIINILGNMYVYYNKGSVLLYNIIFFIIFIVVLIVISIILFFINK
jgi:hypothetical protein